jgi:hypothetical protein
MRWQEDQKQLDPKRLVFIDETWAKTNMAPAHGRCRRGQRLYAKVPHGHWKTTTFVAALRHDGITAPSSSMARSMANVSSLMSKKCLLQRSRRETSS